MLIAAITLMKFCALTDVVSSFGFSLGKILIVPNSSCCLLATCEADG